MRILTWNLWGRNGPWERRREAIAATLAGVRPDVCGLQEVFGSGGWNMAAELAERLGLHWDWAVAHGDPDGAAALGHAVPSRWPIARHAQAPLPTRGPRVWVGPGATGTGADAPPPVPGFASGWVARPPGGGGGGGAARLAGTAPVDGVWPSDHFAVVADIEP